MKTIEVLKPIQLGPVYIPVPAKGKRCPHTDLSRDAMMALITGPRAPVLCLESRSDNGNITKRRVRLASLVAYIDEEAEKQKRERDDRQQGEP